jgi:hypothetical protein
VDSCDDGHPMIARSLPDHSLINAQRIIEGRPFHAPRHRVNRSSERRAAG